MNCLPLPKQKVTDLYRIESNVLKPTEIEEDIGASETSGE